LPSPASSTTSDLAHVDATSDEGSASEPEWIDPVTRADSAVSDTRDEAPSEAEERKDTFNLSLRSSHSKETVSFRGVLDTKLEPDAKLKHALEVDSGPRRPRLLPNPMVTSLLDPTVPAAPQRHPSPAIPAPIVPRTPHQTPFHLQKTLILDLDETLIHSTSRPIGSSHAGGGMLGIGSGLFGRRGRREGHTVEVVLNGRSTTYHVYKRPYVDFFLKKVASWYTLVIYTASMPEYADPVIDWLDNGRGLFAKRLYRESCYLQPSGSYIKDLALVDPDLGRVCFMDNSPISYSWNKANALPIEGWTSDPNDEALLQSIPVLDSLRFVTDVRRILGIRGFN
jgi:CTD nuclear envelope phosphatase 1